MGAPLCERCDRRPAAYIGVDEPEEWGYRNGDEVLGRYLCQQCLADSEAEGPWSSVIDLSEEAA